jgi:hypothetical protein
MLFYDSQGLEVVVYCLFLLLSNIREETHHRFKSTSTKVAKSIKVGLEAGFIFIGSSYIYIKKRTEEGKTERYRPNRNQVSSYMQGRSKKKKIKGGKLKELF